MLLLLMAPRRRAPAEAGSGDERRREAFSREALTHIHRLYGMALRLTQNGTDAEDLVQETYLKAFRFAARFEEGTNMRAWLFTILTNTFRNRRRDAGRDPVAVDSEAVEEAMAQPDGQNSPEQRLLDSALDADVQAALDRLPEAFRQAVWLRDVEDFTYAEIAEMVEVPIGTVMSRISRGRRLLHAFLRDRARRASGPPRDAGRRGLRLVPGPSGAQGAS